MPCNCKEIRKVKTCPTVSVEETILTELRNFYTYVVAKFTALFALPALNTPVYEWRVVADDSSRNGGDVTEFAYAAGDTQYRFNFTLPAGVVFMSVSHGQTAPGAGDGVWFPGNVCPAPDVIDFGSFSAAIGNMAAVTAPAGGEVPAGLYSIASTVENYSPIVTYLVRT